MHDNGPAHRAIITRDDLFHINVQLMFPCPANSPDLNPIEYLRDSMDRALRHQERQPTNLQELAMELIRIWGEIPQRHIRNLALFKRRRRVAVINSGGGHTRY
ncbi:transposable element tcb1 transposase [Plakobranchus ocellatus]|uniref:Transposable element tcb1 transposase n=1 Tax=Plakobranchus ocellatus TaxID=259542 RepID=A0AAV3Z2B0_9GAST|nr:transposable element tcb1 transposase [Plakobranchus ocellatus]